MSLVVGLPNNSYKPITNTGRDSHPALYITKKGALDSLSQVIKFTSFLPMISGSLQLTPASSTIKTGRHDIAEILLKVALNIINQIIFCSASRFFM